VEAQAAEALGLQLDQVAVLEAAEPAVIGAGGEHVARAEGVDAGHPLDAARDLVGHVVGVEVLLEGAVDPQAHREAMRVGDLVGGDDVRAIGAKVSRDFIW
jgi:hypothetical protein